MRAEADEVVCLRMPEFFMAVGLHYRDFGQTSDNEVMRLLGKWHAERDASLTTAGG
jgi:putative phosphoribosyl transferase